MKLLNGQLGRHNLIVTQKFSYLGGKLYCHGTVGPQNLSYMERLNVLFREFLERFYCIVQLMIGPQKFNSYGTKGFHVWRS